jgi:hypothetical protein
MFVTNTWTFPLLVIFISGWIIFRYIYRQRIDWLALLVGGILEFVYINDPTVAEYTRTNTVMKWWGWIQTGVVRSLGESV